MQGRGRRDGQLEVGVGAMALGCERRLLTRGRSAVVRRVAGAYLVGCSTVQAV